MKLMTCFIVKAIALAFFFIPNSSAQVHVVDLLLNPADVTVTANPDDQKTGMGLTCGDINGDGFADILMGTPQSVGNSFKPGHVDIIYGSAQPFSTIDLGEVQADVTITGRDSTGQFGINILVDDFNRDGIDDIVVAEPHASPQGRIDAGAVYIFWGKSEFPDSIELQQKQADITIIGANGGDHLGTSLAAGDISGNGLLDFLIGAEGVNSPQSISCGATYVIYNTSELETSGFVDCLTEFNGHIIYGIAANDLSGRAVASGDINGDKLDDIIIGAHKADTPLPDIINDAGEVYIIWSKPDLPKALNLAETNADVTIFGSERKGWLGYSLHADDMDNDGFSDLIIGAPQINWQGENDAGKVYLFSGKKLTQVHTIDLKSDSPKLQIIGPEAYANLGASIATGLFNDNDIPDLVLGAPQASPSDRKAAGMAFLFYDVTGLDSVFDLGEQNSNVMVLGEAASGFLGKKICSGDFNKDGLNDLFLSAPDFQPAARVYCLFNSSFITVDFSSTIPIPDQFEVYQNYPNPFNLLNSNNIGTSIKYDVFKTSEIGIKIYNINGKEVVTLLNDKAHFPGAYTISWNGRDSSGRLVSSGIYLISISSDNLLKWRRMVLIR